MISDEQRAVLKHVYKSTIKYIVVIIATILLMYNCKGCKVTPPISPEQNHIIENIQNAEIKIGNIDSTIFKINNRLKGDSVNLSKQVSKYKAKYLNALNNAPDTCKTYIIEVATQCDAKDSIYKQIIVKKDSINTEREKQIELWKTISVSKDTLINIKNDSLVFMNKLVKKEFKRGRRNGFKNGVIAGSVSTGAIIWSGLIMK